MEYPFKVSRKFTIFAKVLGSSNSRAYKEGKTTSPNSRVNYQPYQKDLNDVRKNDRNRV